MITPNKKEQKILNETMERLDGIKEDYANPKNGISESEYRAIIYRILLDAIRA